MSSNVIENQVVQMEFDNERFEKNVHVSINSVKQLQDAISMGGNTSSALVDSFNNLNTSALQRSIDAISERFSTFGIVGMTAIQRITNAAINLGVALEKEVVKPFQAGWNQIITGGTSRAANIEQATFQLKGIFGTATDGQIKLQLAMTGTSEEIKNITGLTEDFIVAENAANYAVADTAYGLDSAAKAASVLATSGVDVVRFQEELADESGRARTEMQVALRAISGTAAMANSSYDDIARIFEKIAGGNRIMGEELNSLNAKGLNAAAVLADYLNDIGRTANATESDIREMCSKSEIDFMTFARAMDSAYGEHAKDANSTFSGAFDNMKFALSKIGADFVAPLRDDLIPVLNNVRMAFNAVRASLTPFLTAFKNSSHMITDGLVAKFATLIGSGETDSEWKASDQWTAAISNMTEVVQTATDILQHFLNFIGSIITPIVSAWKELFPSKGFSGFLDILNKIKDFVAGMELSATAMEKLRRTARGIFSVLKIAGQIVTPIIDGIKELLKYFGILDADVVGVTADIGDAIYELSESGAIGQGVQTIVDNIIGFIKHIDEVIKETNSLDLGQFDITLDGIGRLIRNFFGYLAENVSLSNSAEKVIETLGGIVTAIGATFSQLIGGFFEDPTKAGQNIVSMGEIAILVFGLVKTFQGMRSIKAIDSDLFKQIVISVVGISLSLMMLSSIDQNRLTNAAVVIGSLFLTLAFVFRVISNSFSIFNANLINITHQASGIKGLLKATFVANVTTIFDSIGTFFKQLGTSLMVGSIGVSVYLLTKGISNIIGAFTSLVDAVGDVDYAMIVISASIGVIYSFLAIIMRLYDHMINQAKGINKNDSIKAATGIFAMATLLKTCSSIVMELAGLNSFGSAATGIIGFYAIIGGIIGLYKMIEKSKIGLYADSKKHMQILIGMAISLALVMHAISEMAKVIVSSSNGTQAVLTSAGVLLGVIAMMGLLIKTLSQFPMSNDVLLTLAGMSLVIGAISLFGLTLMQLSQISWEQLLPVLATIGIVLLSVTALAALAYALPGAEIALFAVAAAIASLGIAAAGIGAGLYLGAKAIDVLISALIRLGEAWNENGPSIIDAMRATLTEIAKMLPQFIAGMIEGFIEGIKSNIDSLTTLIPYISTFIGTVIVGVIRSLADNIGPLVNALVDFIVNLINSLGSRLPDIYGAIKNFLVPMFEGFVGLVSGFLGVAAEGIGTVFGSLLGGIISGLTKALEKVSLVNFANELSNFMLSLKPFIDGIEGLDESTVNAAKTLVEVIATITAEDIKRGLTSWITGGNSLVKFGEELAEFGPYIKEYSDSVDGINVENVEASTAAAKMIAEFAKTIPNEGGLLAKIVGDNDIASFGQKLKEFGPYIKAYSEDVAGLDVAAVETSVCAALMISEFAKTIPNEGGLLAMITGDNDIETFGKHLKSFGKQISKYAEEVKDIDARSVESSVNAARMLSEFAAEIPNSGGLKAIFEGDNSIDKFGEQLTAFGKSIIDYYNSIKNIDADMLLTTTEALTGLFKVLGYADKISTGSVSNMQDILEAVAEIGISSFLNTIAFDSSKDVRDAIDEFFDNIEDEFDKSTKKLATFVTIAGGTIATAFAAGMTSDFTRGMIRRAGTEIAEEGIKAIEDALDDPINEPAGETIHCGVSEIMGVTEGAKQEAPNLYSTLADIAGISVDELDISDDAYDNGYNAITQFNNGMEAAASNTSPWMNSLMSRIDRGKPTAVTRTQHEGYISPNYIPDSKPINDLAAANESWGDAMFNYSRGAEEASESTEDYASAYKDLEASAAAASRSISSASNSTSKSGKSAKSAKTELEKLTDKVDDIMDKYENLWNDAKEKANEDLFKGVDKQGDEFLDSIEEIMDKYKNIYKSAVEEVNGEDLFAEVNDEDTSYAPETLLRNLEDQVSQANELNTIISSLSTRVTDENLRAAIAKMDVDDLPELRALYRMSDADLNKYETAYERKVQARQNKIQNELSADLSQITGGYVDVATYVATDASTNRLLNNLQAQVDQLNEYNDTVASLMVRIKDVHLREAIASMGVDSLDELKALNRMTDAQLDEYIAVYNQKISAGAISIKNELSAELSSLLGTPLDIEAFHTQYKAGMVDLTDWVKGLDSGTKAVGESAADTITSGMSDRLTEKANLEEAEKAGKEYVMAIGRGMSDAEAIKYLQGAMDGIVSMIIEDFREYYTSDLTASGVAMISAVLQGIEQSKDPGFDEIIDGIPMRVIECIESYRPQYVNSGRYIVQGIKEGLTSPDLVKQIEAAASMVAAKTLSAVKKTLEIKSPSRVFMQIGKYLDEGFAIGIKDNAGLAADEAGDMAGGTLSAVQDAIQMLSGMLDGSIDLNPTITPTLDLSEINARSAALSSMFNGRQIAVQAYADDRQAEMITKLGDIMAEQNAEPRTMTFNQNNYSPKALSRTEIYRQTRNGFSQLASAIQ